MIPRHEHPNPQVERANWLNLNGEWDFEFDFGNSKPETGILSREEWEKRLLFLSALKVNYQALNMMILSLRYSTEEKSKSLPGN